MCTVTYIPLTNHCYLTSNRDEHITRGQAIAPKKILANGYELIYPKDADAGGTWIATKNTGEAIVLLNGGFYKHKSNPPYKKSRGIILLNIYRNWAFINFTNWRVNRYWAFYFSLFWQSTTYRI